MADEDLGRNLMQQALDLWINPEIERRREAGKVGDNFVVSKAQIIMNLDADAPEIRFNEEIKAVAEVEWARELEVGEDATEAEVRNIKNFMLTDHDPNAGHLTMMLFKGRWIISFDFRYNAARVANMVRAAREFLDVASSALKENRMRPFVDNLFSATELMAKGHLLLSPDEALLKSKKHTIVSARFNQERNLGNVEPRHVDLLNRLQDLRGSARYLDKDFMLTEEEAKIMIGTAEDMFETVRASVPERHRTSDDF